MSENQSSEESKNVEAFIAVKTVPGKTQEVVRQLADWKDDHISYKIEGMKYVYRSSGKYDVIAHVSANDAEGVFRIADFIGKIKNSNNSAVSGTQVIFLVPKHMGDP